MSTRRTRWLLCAAAVWCAHAELAAEAPAATPSRHSPPWGRRKGTEMQRCRWSRAPPLPATTPASATAKQAGVPKNDVAAFDARTAPTPFRFISFDPPRAYPGLPYYTRMAAVGGKWPYSFALVKSPAGARITQDRGEVLWTAGKEGPSAEFQVKATDSSGKSIAKLWKVSVSTDHFYFVATSQQRGDDETGDGSVTRPWASVQRALNGAKGTGTIYVREGLYHERSRTKDAKGGFDQFLLMAGMPGFEFKHEEATRENPLHIASYPGERAILEPVEAVMRGLQLRTPYALVENIEIRNMEQMGLCAGDYAIIRGCDIHGILGTTSNCEGIWCAGKHPELVVQDCEFHDIRQPSMPTHTAAIILYGVENGLIEDNQIYRIDSTGILDKDSGRANTYRGNYVHDLGGHGSDLTVLGQGHHWDCVMHDNVFSGKTQRGIQIGLHDDAVYRIQAHHNTVLGALGAIRAEETTLWNNVFQIETGTVVFAGVDTPGFMARRNVFWSGDVKAFMWGPLYQKIPTEDLPAFAKETGATDCLFTKPRFEDATKGAFHLVGPSSLSQLAGEGDYLGAHESVLEWVAGGAPVRSAANIVSRLAVLPNQGVAGTDPERP